MLRIGQVETTATSDDKYTDGSVAGGVAATRLRAAAFNAIQEELANIVESAGLTLSIDDQTQVLTGLKKLFLSRSNPFSDIATDGAAAIATALVNLGLGGSHGIQTIITSASFTVPDNIYDIYISASGAGGGGGGGYSSSYSGSGGGGGASIYRQHFSVTPGTVLSVVIGSGGAGGSVGIAGYSGGATSVGSLFSLAGGGGGNPGISGAGGNSAGLPGGVGSVAGEDAFNNVPGSGGGNLLGVGGVKRAAAGGAGIYGGGGAGGYSGNAGGAGDDGVVIIEWER